MSENWETIALDKFSSGEWKPTPWQEEPWFLEGEKELKHFPHISTLDPKYIAYVNGYFEEKSQLRVHTIKPGRYLTRFYNQKLLPSEIRSWATKIAINDFEVLFATTPDEIQEVYENGPRSCMSGDAAYFKSKIHPTRIYGAGDLAVAYIKNKNNKVAVRALCWPKRKVFSSVYGDGGEYSKALKNYFYSLDWHDEYRAFEGAKCLKIEYENGFVAPYLDGLLGFKIHPKHLEIRRYDYDIRANSETGVIGDTCPNCDEYLDACDTMMFEGDSYCYDCWFEIAFRCDYCEEAFSIDDARGTESYTLCEDCYTSHFKECDECGDTIKTEDVYTAPNDESMCESCYIDCVADCENCGEEMMAEEVYTSDKDDSVLCEECYESEEDEE